MRMNDPSAVAALSMSELRAALLTAEAENDTAEIARLTDQMLEIVYNARLKRSIPGDA